MFTLYCLLLHLNPFTPLCAVQGKRFLSCPISTIPNSRADFLLFTFGYFLSHFNNSHPVDQGQMLHLIFFDAQLKIQLHFHARKHLPAAVTRLHANAHDASLAPTSSPRSGKHTNTQINVIQI